MKRLKTLIGVFVVLLMLTGAFAYGRHLSQMSMSLALRRAHMVASGYFPSRGPIPFDPESRSDQDAVVPVAASAAGAGVRVSQSTSSSADSSSDNIDDLLSSDSPMATFQQVYLLLKDQYVEKIPSDAPLAHGAAAAMLDSLDDANSRFVDATERAALEAQAKGVYAGTGIVFTVRRVLESGGLVDRQVTVIDCVPGSPAAKAGIKTGDVITTVDGHWIIGYDPFAAQEKMLKKLSNDEYDWDKAVDAIDTKISQGISLAKAQTLLDTTQAKPVALVVERPGAAKPIDFSLDCAAPTAVKDVEWHKLDNGQGYIRVNVFDDSTAADLAQAFTALGGASGVVLDMRDCPGGMLDPAITIAHAMAPSANFGMVVVRDNRAPKTAGLGTNTTQSVSSASSIDPEADAPKFSDFGTRTEDLKDMSAETGPAIAYDGPLVVLVNKGTANTAELLAAFLRDHRGARIVGASTFGDAMAQTLFPLTDGSGFTLTTGMLKTDIGKPFNISGLSPDIALKDTGTAGEPKDPGLERACAVLGEHPVASSGGSSQS